MVIERRRPFCLEGAAERGSPSVTLDEEQLEGLAGFRFALRRFLVASEAFSRARGVTPQQYQAMLSIRTKRGSPMSVGELADQLLLTHHGAVQLIDRLAESGFAQRERSPHDRRTVFLTLTPHGKTLLEELAAEHLDEMLEREALLSRSLRQLKRMKP
jgi:DNA-binding MarR family transcriptional regulator